jgi:uncharacterized protein
MARFQPAENFHSADDALQLLPLRFERARKHYLVSNMVGDFVRLSGDELSRLVELNVRPGDGLYEKAYAAHLITRAGQTAQRQLLALRLRSRMAFLREPTLLIIFTIMSFKPAGRLTRRLKSAWCCTH